MSEIVLDQDLGLMFIHWVIIFFWGKNILFPIFDFCPGVKSYILETHSAEVFVPRLFVCFFWVSEIVWIRFGLNFLFPICLFILSWCQKLICDHSVPNCLTRSPWCRGDAISCNHNPQCDGKHIAAINPPTVTVAMTTGPPPLPVALPHTVPQPSAPMPGFPPVMMPPFRVPLPGMHIPLPGRFDLWTCWITLVRIILL